ncbi:MAG: phospholipase D-like domain-containing protein [Verrucomicrobiota bacterium]|nr:phospholipase D-like domain-containing protein [Verrucomicrobiota bacterium]
MQKVCRITFFLFVLLVSLETTAAGHLVSARVETAFQEDCLKLVLKKIKNARKEILVAIFTFTLDDIADELIEKKKAGLTVLVKVDEHQADSKYTKPIVKKLRNAKIQVKLIKMPAYKHMHHKFIVIDKKTVLTGSYNFTHSATVSNWENCVCIQSNIVANRFHSEWQHIKDRN